MAKARDKIPMIGRRWGSLRVESKDGYHGTYPMWRCICDCGVYVTVVGRTLRRGKMLDCGSVTHDPNNAPPGHPTIRAQMMALLRRRGETLDEIGIKMGVSRQRVWAVLKKMEARGQWQPT